MRPTARPRIRTLGPLSSLVKWLLDARRLTSSPPVSVLPHIGVDRQLQIGLLEVHRQTINVKWNFVHPQEIRRRLHPPLDADAIPVDVRSYDRNRAPAEIHFRWSANCVHKIDKRGREIWFGHRRHKERYTTAVRTDRMPSSSTIRCLRGIFMPPSWDRTPGQLHPTRSGIRACGWMAGRVGAAREAIPGSPPARRASRAGPEMSAS